MNSSYGVEPFRSPIARETDTSGGIAATIWAWFSITSSSIISIPWRFSADLIALSQSLQCDSFSKVLYRYLVTHRRWYLLCPTECALQTQCGRILFPNFTLFMVSVSRPNGCVRDNSEEKGKITAVSSSCVNARDFATCTY